ncbi:MAG: HEAT repeat domain-containing protein [Planctomycetota bacterium]
MLPRMLLNIAFFSLAALFIGCQSTVTRGGVELTPDEIAQIEAAEEKEPVDLVDERLQVVIEALNYRHGSLLLRDLEYLIGMRELAVAPILKALPDAPARTRANLIYVLGYSKMPEARQAIVDHLGYPDDVVRFEATAALLHQGDLAAVPTLIDYLQSEDKMFRYKSIQALRLATGKDFGYRFAAPEGVRAASVSDWKQWWGTEKNRLMTRAAAGEK